MQNGDSGNLEAFDLLIWHHLIWTHDEFTTPTINGIVFTSNLLVAPDPQFQGLKK